MCFPTYSERNSQTNNLQRCINKCGVYWIGIEHLHYNSFALLQLHSIASESDTLGPANELELNLLQFETLEPAGFNQFYLGSWKTLFYLFMYNKVSNSLIQYSS